MGMLLTTILPRGSARRMRRTVPVILCLRRRRGPTPLVDQADLVLAVFSLSESDTLSSSSFKALHLTWCNTSSSSSPGPPSVKLSWACFSSPSSVSSTGFFVSGALLEPSSAVLVGSGVVARLEAPPRLKGEPKGG